MEETKKKIIKMCDELTKFFMNRDAEDITIDIHSDNKKYTIKANAKILLTEEEAEHICLSLAKHRDEEYDFYCELMGECDEDELELLFLLTDKSVIYYEDDILSFNLTVKK